MCANRISTARGEFRNGYRTEGGSQSEPFDPAVSTGVGNLARMDQARSLLLNTHMSVTEVAFEVGFEDPLHFSRALRDEEPAGCLPPRRAGW